LYNILNAHGLGVYYTITTSQEMNHHYSTAGLSPSAITMATAGIFRLEQQEFLNLTEIHSVVTARS